MKEPSIHVSDQGEACILALEGRLDPVGGPAFAARCKECLAAGKTHLVWDFREVDFISSAGLRSVLVIAKAVEAQGGGIVLFGMRPMVENVFRTAGFDTFLRFCSSLEEALAALQQQPS